MSRQQLFRQAMAVVERRRQKAEAEAEERRLAAARAVPELEILDRQKTEAGALAAGLAADGRREAAAEKLALMKDIGARRAMLLRQHGIREEELRPRWFCPRCEDTGRANGAVCQCVNDEIRQQRRQAIHSAGPLKLCSFDNFDTTLYPETMEGVRVSPRKRMEGIWMDCREYANMFGPRSPSLFMYGNAGLGKTHLALSIASVVLEKGFDVIYVTAQNAFSTISEDKYSGSDDFFESMMEADLLVLDDLGTEYIDSYTLSKMYELVNGRMNHRPTIYTSNIRDDIQLMQRYTEKISSRLLGECTPVLFLGQDLRPLVKKSRY